MPCSSRIRALFLHTAPQSSSVIDSMLSRSQTMAMDGGRLVRMCIESASADAGSVERWRRQRRTLERLPAHLADALLRSLRHRRLLFPSLLEFVLHSLFSLTSNQLLKQTFFFFGYDFANLDFLMMKGNSSILIVLNRNGNYSID